MNITLSPRIILSGLIILMGLIIAAVPQNTTLPYKVGVEKMLEEIKNGTQFILPDQVADMIIKKDPTLQMIDIRSKDEYEKYHLPNAVNIPLDDVLSEEWKETLDQDVMINVFYSNGNTKANEAWLLTRQLGYNNNYVMLGGLNFWVETIMNPKAPATTSPDDEFAKYDFRKGASNVLGGGSLIENSNIQDAPEAKPPIIKRREKKAVKGGCS